jgi:antitoxin HicB
VIWLEKRIFKVPLLLDPQKEGGWTVTSPILPELVTEVDRLDELNDRVSDAVEAVIELYYDMGKELPTGMSMGGEASPVWFESLVVAER